MPPAMFTMVLLASNVILGRSLIMRSFSMGRTKAGIKMVADTLLPTTIKNGHPSNNIPDAIILKVGKNLHLQKNHPLNIIKKK